ncbi:MAG TPA: thiamine pyrophosphate-binding protein [Methanothermococcus okinawensis]|uniref:Thiamine pyrophosphate-binding protein n=1 Tax=Methanothermococcus okinawensis TaxID=155863 RepID=A0A833DQ65_9EURY|nr:thiamine pyrophosphate-binding protein [Methanothermococcus okinawensis]
MKFTEALINFLLKKNIKTIFSYPGEQIIELYKELNNSPIKNILVRHEQGAAHMADGYSRITNYVGVCLATGGPGVTNLITGIATAYKDSSSVLAITGRCERKYINKNYFQEIKMDFLNMYKGYFMDKPNLDNLENVFYDCLYSKRPISLNIPQDILKSNEITDSFNKYYEYNSYNEYNNPNKYEYSHRGNNEDSKNCETVKNNIRESIKKIKDKLYKIGNVKKPLILIGQGIYGILPYTNMVRINNILKELDIPIVTTFPARGVINENYKNSLGLVGRRGTTIANNYLLESDIIISIGASLSYNTLPDSIRESILKKIIPINIESKINSLDDIKYIFEEINNLEIVNVNNNKSNMGGNSLNNKNDIKNNIIQKLGDYSSKIKEILDNLPDNGIIVTDAGNHTVFVSLLKKCIIPRNIISSHGMGTMGFGIPTSIGVKFGCLDYNIDREVISISGDGGFQMNLQELATIEENNLKILMIVMKNNNLNVFGSIKNPNFNKISEAYGIDNVYIEDVYDIRQNIRYYLRNNKPYLMVIECENEKLPKLAI